MSDGPRREMDGVDIADFLQRQPTGVLALANGDVGYGVPVSFAFDPESRDVYLRLGYGPESQKERFLATAERVSLVVYADTPEGWKSVVVEGTPETVAKGSLDTTLQQSLDGLHIPYYQVHDRPAEEIEFDLVRIDATSMTGIVEG